VQCILVDCFIMYSQLALCFHFIYSYPEASQWLFEKKTSMNLTLWLMASFFTDIELTRIKVESGKMSMA